MKKTQKPIGLIVLVLLFGIGFADVLPVHAQTTVTVTLSAGDHTVAIGAIAFTRHNEDGELVMDHLAFDDPTFTQFKCNPGEVKSKTFDVPQEPNDLEIIYISDDGDQTPYTIPTDRFEFDKQYTLPSPSPGSKQEPPPDDPPGDALIWVTLTPVGMDGIHAVYTLSRGVMELDIHVVDEDYFGKIYSIEIYPQVQVPSWDTVEGIQAPKGWNVEKTGDGVRFYTETNPLTQQRTTFKFKVNAKRISWYIRIYAANEVHDTIGILLGNRWWLQYAM